ncbi:MAG: quinone oxidoreductase [Thermaerobacter sp.]|nr:quinone oxidoreductase [Thermaerobacter sp.]
MRSIRLHQFGAPDVLVAQETPMPKPAADEVLVRMEAAGINYLDVYQRSGAYPVSLPFTPGQEAAGTVTEVGSAVRLVAPGDRVAWLLVPGAYAEYSIVPEGRLVPVSPHLSMRVAAAILFQGVTAWEWTTAVYPIRAGQHVLVHAAGTGVGRLLVQMSRAQGAHVLGTADDARKLAAAEAAGAEVTALTQATNLSKAVREWTDGRGVDVVYDGVGGPTWDMSLSAVTLRGTVVSFGQAGGPLPNVDISTLGQRGSLTVIRPVLAHYLDPEELRAAACAVFDGVMAGTWEPVVDKIYSLDRASDAHRRLESGDARGKLLLVP